MINQNPSEFVRFYTVNHLYARGWSRRLIDQLLGPADTRSTVSHWLNSVGRKNYRADRVAAAEQLPAFAALLRRRATRAGFPPACGNSRFSPTNQEQPHPRVFYVFTTGANCGHRWPAGLRHAVDTALEHRLQPLTTWLNRVTEHTPGRTRPTGAWAADLNLAEALLLGCDLHLEVIYRVEEDLLWAVRCRDGLQLRIGHFNHGTNRTTPPPGEPPAAVASPPSRSAPDTTRPPEIRPADTLNHALAAFDLTTLANVRFPVPDGRTLDDIHDLVAQLPVTVKLIDHQFVFSGRSTGDEREDTEALHRLQSLAFVVIPGIHECQIRVELFD